MPLSLKYIASTSDVIFIWHTSATVSSGPTYKVCVWKKLKNKRAGSYKSHLIFWFPHRKEKMVMLCQTDKKLP